MATWIGNTTGNWSTAGTWNQVTNTPSIHASTNISISTSNLFTATFTAPNTTNACTGVAFYQTTKGTVGNITVTLQESTVDTAATGTVAATLFTNNGTLIYFKFASPYVFTTTGAGAYRFKVVNSSAGGPPTFAADSGGANVAYIATDDRTGPPASTDDVFVLGNNGANTVTITVDGSQTIGSGVASNIQRSVTGAVRFGERGKIVWDTASSATLTHKGSFYGLPGSIWNMGTVVTPYPAGKVASLITNQNGVSGQFGITTNGDLVLQGAPQTSTSLWKTTYSSGSGTAASPLITATAVDWAVGDEILVSSTNNGGGQNEYKFIITKNSSTSYVISNTSGGSENALAFSHTTSARILNVQRNVLITTTSPTTMGTNVTLYLSNSEDVDWIRIDNPSGSGFGLIVGAGGGQMSALDYSVAYQNIAGNAFFWNSSSTAITYTGLVACKAPTVGYSFASSGMSNISLVDCFVFNASQDGFNGIASGCTFTGCCIIGNLRGFNISSTSGCSFNSCEFQANSSLGIWLAGANSANVFTSCLFGTKGTNTAFGDVLAAGYCNNDFVSCTFGSATTIGGYASMVSGSRIGVTDQASSNTTYKREGIFNQQGTTVFTLQYAAKFAPESSTAYLTTTSSVPVNNGQLVTAQCWWVRNHAYGVSTLPYIALSGSGISTTTSTYSASEKTITGATNATPIVITSNSHGYSNGDKVLIESVGGTTAANGNWYIAGVTTNTFQLVGSIGNGVYTSGGTSNKWQQLTVSGTPTANALATLEFGVKSSTANAAAYLDDITIVPFPIDTGTLEYWYRGNLPPIILGTSLTARGVWTDDPYVDPSVTEATALAYTGISLNTSTGVVAISSNHSVTEVYMYIKAKCRSLAIPNTFFTTADGLNWQTSTLSGANWTFTANLTGTGSILMQGNILIQTSGTISLTISDGTLRLPTAGTFSGAYDAITIDFTGTGTYDLRSATITGTISLDSSNDSTVTVRLIPATSYTNLDPTHITVDNAVVVSIDVTGIIPGSRIQIYDVDNTTQLVNEIVLGTSKSVDYTYSTDVSIRIRLAYVNGVTAKQWLETTQTLTSAGLSYAVAQEENTVYDDANIDGSTVTEFSVSGVIIRIYVDDPDNTTTGQRMYNWYQYYLFTEAGIRDQSGTYITATDSTHYFLDDTMKIINQDLSNPLNITGANITPNTGAATNIFDLSNGASIALNFDRVEGFPYNTNPSTGPSIIAIEI